MHMLIHSSRSLTILVVFAVLLSGLVSISCMPKQSGEPEPEILPELLQFAHVGRGRQARVDTTFRLIADPATWAAYQDSLQPIQPFEKVEFSREMILLAALPVPTGGYDLRIEFVEFLSDTITVNYRLFLPGADCRNAEAPGVVFDVARLGRIEGELRFLREQESLKCTES